LDRAGEYAAGSKGPAGFLFGEIGNTKIAKKELN
jgi:hypothetical protein